LHIYTEKYLTQFEVRLPLPIWQIRFDEKTGWLGVETRDADTLQNAFYVIDSQNGSFVLDDYKTKEGWWSGLEDIYNGCLYLHRSNNQQFGQHAGILALDADTGNMLWEQPLYSFYGLAQEYILAEEPDQDATNLVRLDYRTGTIIPGFIPLTETRISLNEFQARRQQVSKVPSHYQENNIFFPELQLFLQEVTRTKAVLAIDYLETDQYFVIGYYQTQPDLKYTYRLAVFDLNGKLLLQEKLKSNVTGIGLDNFFILNNTLIFNKYKDTLVGYGL